MTLGTILIILLILLLLLPLATVFLFPGGAQQASRWFLLAILICFVVVWALLGTPREQRAQRMHSAAYGGTAGAEAEAAEGAPAGPRPLPPEEQPQVVREVMDVLNEARPRAYTSVMSLLNVMTDKKLLVRQPRGRAFVYQPRFDRGKTLRRLVGDLLGRAFEGSASQFVAHLLDQTQPSPEELAEIRRTIEQYQKQRGK